MPDQIIIKSKPVYRRSLLFASIFFGSLFVADLAVIGYLTYQVLNQEVGKDPSQEFQVAAKEIAEEVQNWLLLEGPKFQVSKKREQLVEMIVHDPATNRARYVQFRKVEFLDDQGNVIAQKTSGPVPSRYRVLRKWQWEEEVSRPPLINPASTDFSSLMGVAIKERIDQYQDNLWDLFWKGSLMTLLLLCFTFLYVLRLIRKSQRMEAEAQMADRLAYVGSLASGLAHEIRNPLNAMAMNLQMLEEEIGFFRGSNRGEVRSMIDSALGEVQRLNLLVTQFLDYARPTKPKFLPSDVNRIVGDTLDFMKADLESGRIEVHRDFAPVIPAIPMDDRQIRQALMNVLLNAKHVLPAGGRIDVSTSVRGRGEVRIAVRDNGPGITPGDLNKVFQIFYSTKGGGTGMGLPIARRILENHGGSIEVETLPGEGACFTLILPRTKFGIDSSKNQVQEAGLLGSAAVAKQ